jgi:hypothetical protein
VRENDPPGGAGKTGEPARGGGEHQSPAFFRVIQEMQPTLLIDEADTLLPGNAQLRGILNAGYTQDMAYVLRVVSETGGSRLARFSCWGPKAIA